jgi:hypothetical protein
MKLTIKTLKGGKFEIEADQSSTILDVKGIIVSCWCDFDSKFWWLTFHR